MYGVFAIYTQFAYIPTKTSVWRVHTSVSHPKTSKEIIRYYQDKKGTWKYLHKTYPTIYPYSEVEAEGRINSVRLNLAYLTNNILLAKEALKYIVFPGTLKMRIKLCAAHFSWTFHLLVRIINHKNNHHGILY